MIDKKRAYQALVSDVKEYYTAQEAEHHDESVYLTWYDDCEEINLWTYWQGRGKLNAKIMLVGQDWGSPTDAAGDYMAQFAEINAGNRSSYDLDGVSITDNKVNVFRKPSVCDILHLNNPGFLEVCEVKKTVEELLQSSYWIIDILPSQVPKDSPGQYFAVEKVFLQGDRIEEIKQKHIDLILKLNCYRDISISDETEINPLPKHIADEMKKRYLYIMTGESMILSEPDDTHLTVFNPDPQLLELLRQLASGEGLFVWKPNF